MKKDKNIRLFVIYGIGVFIGLFLFLTLINPLGVYDADDWLYIYDLRRPYPQLHAWNPTRVFPEFFMPIVSYFGALVINPLINNYYFSLTLAHGLFSSVLLTIYFLQFSVLFYKRKFASAKASIGYGCLFILLHFISHIFDGSDNYSFLISYNFTVFYFYILSAVLNATLVMHFMSYGGIKAFFQNSTLIHKIIVIVWAYFSINSNLFSSVILATYVGTELLLNLISEIKEKRFKFKEYCLSNWINLFIIICWFGANIIETQGGRADSIGKSVISNLPVTFMYGIAGLFVINIFVTAFVLVVFVLWRKNRGKLNDTAVRFLVYIGLQLAYLILLSAASEPQYAIGTEVVIDSYFFIFMGVIACLNELVNRVSRKYYRTIIILAGTLVLLFIQPGKLYHAYNESNLSYEQLENIMNDFIDQVKTAEERGEKEMILVVPKYEEAGNWPLSVSLVGDRIPEALYRHKIIDSRVIVTEVVISEEKNKKFGIELE